MPRCNEAVAPLIAGSAANQDSFVGPFLLDPVRVRTGLRTERVQRRQRLSDRQTCEFHELAVDCPPREFGPIRRLRGY